MKGIYKEINEEVKKKTAQVLNCMCRAKFSTKIKKQLFTYDKRKQCIVFNLKYLKTIDIINPKELASSCCDMIINNKTIVVSSYGLRGQK